MKLLDRVAADKRLSALALVLLALVIRAPQLGNPVIHIDEQFYLLVGERMWHGDLPFVDIWDRKPIGLFLIYAATRLFGGDGVLAYQLVACAFAAATAFAIARLGAHAKAPRGGLLGGLVYLVFLMVNGGDGGQAPVFYNLFTALAAWAVVRAIRLPGFGTNGFGWGCAAMALTGLALQVKYSVLLEGVAFGCTLLFVAWRRGTPLPRLAAMGAAWIVVALAPTGLVLLAYAALGQLDALVFTNFVSIFQRPPSEGADLYRRVMRILVRTVPLAAAACAAAWLYRRDRDKVRSFLGLWALVAAASVIVFGTYHDHYALPLLLPFAAAAAPLFARPRIGLPVALLLAAIGGYLAVHDIGKSHGRTGSGREVRAVADRIRPRLKDCLFVFSGPPVLYPLTRSCLPTPYVFPTLLSESRDAATMRIDALAELRRVTDARPQFIVTREFDDYPEAAPAALAHMRSVLARDYCLALDQPAGRRHLLVYERRNGNCPAGY